MAERVRPVIVQPIDYFLIVWFALAALSTAYVAYDQFRNNPEPTVMRWGFILVTLYMGPLGLLLYVLADKEPRPGEHEQFTSPLWKQGVGSTIHCVAGDATGIILAAVVTAALGLPMRIDLIVEYVAGFAFGLFIFQSLFMKEMMGGTYWENVRKTFLPEFISMNAMMAGMAPVMSLLMMARDMRAMEPTELVFWGVMSLGVMVGFATAYPVNVWMVKRGLKHGLMTERKPGTRFAIASKAENTDEQRTMGDHAAGENTRPMQMSGEQNHKGHDMGRADGQRQPAGSPESGGHQGMKSDATAPQLAAVAGVMTLMLLAGLIVPGFFVNLSLSARDVGGAIMPPGMIMDFDTPAAAMLDMSAVRPRDVGYRAPKDARGDQVLQPRQENGVKVFDITASVIRWNILPGVTVDAYAYNRQIPGPRLELTQGDKVRINFRNELPETATIHWHGLIVPNRMDGPAEVTQPPVPQGGTYVYEFTVEQSGTYFYHSHDHPDRTQALGLYGALLIAPKDAVGEPRADVEYTIQLQEWLKREWLTYPAMLMEGALPNYFTINGKAYPDTDTIRMKVGQTVKLRFIGTNNNFVHPMHVHGGPFDVVARDGETIPESARFKADTVNVGPGQRYDVIWTAQRPGKWLVHCHIPHHTANNNVEEKGGGGLTMVIEVAP
ncbi:multicopper oxidase [Streptomyces purpurogeneiscleroticus]|nr:multicopper oxidase [Streptomyces purpurogeneiscleroticus]